MWIYGSNTHDVNRANGCVAMCRIENDSMQGATRAVWEMQNREKVRMQSRCNQYDIETVGKSNAKRKRTMKRDYERKETTRRRL